MLKKLVIVIAGIFLGAGITAGAAQITVPSASSFGQILVGLTNGTYQASSSPTIAGLFTASNFTATTITGTSTFPNIAITTTLSLFGTVGTALSDFCVAITGGSGLCDGIDDTGGVGGGTDGNWSFFNNSGIRLATTSNTVLIAGTATTSTSSIEVQGNKGITSYGVITAPYFIATSSSINTFPQLAFTNGTGTSLMLTASSTANDFHVLTLNAQTLAVSSISNFNGLTNNGGATTTNLAVNGSSTIQSATIQNATTTTFAITNGAGVQECLHRLASGAVVGTGSDCGSGGAVAWGAISGTLSAQTDLQSALDLKLSTSSMNGFDKGYFFSTTSADYWDTTKGRWSSTSQAYWASLNDWATTSANYWYTLQSKASSTLLGSDFNTFTNFVNFAGGLISATSTVLGDQVVTGNSTTTGISKLLSKVSVGSTTAPKQFNIYTPTVTFGNSSLQSSADGLAVIGNSATYILRDSGSANQEMSWNFNGGVGELGTVNNGNFAIKTNSLQRLTVRGDGRVGIGSTTPFTDLSLGNTAGNTINLATTSTSTFTKAIYAPCFSVDNTTCLTSTGGTPAGSNMQIQYNNGGAFGASADFSWDNTNKILNIATSADQTSHIMTGGRLVIDIGGDGKPLDVNTNGGLTSGSTGGDITFTSGRGSTTARGGGISFIAGSGSQDTNGTGDGGGIFFAPGRGGSVSGVNGQVAFSDPTSLFSALFVTSAITADRSFTFPDASGIFCLTTTCATFSYLFNNFTNWATTTSATGTSIQLNGTAGFYASGTSHFADFTFTNATGTQATSTNFFASILQATSALFTSLTGTNATITNATTTSLAVTNVGNALYLGGNSSGSAVPYTGTSCTNQFIRSLNGTGVSTCATVANTDLANSSITINGSSVALGGSITVASTTLLANNNTFSGQNIFENILRSTTTNATSTSFFSTVLSATNALFTGFTATRSTTTNATSTFFSATSLTATGATTTSLFATTASTSNFFGAGLTSCAGASNAITWTNGSFGCNSLTSGGASSTLLADSNTFTGLNSFSNLTITRSTTTNATSTSFFSSIASSTDLFSTNATLGTVNIRSLTVDSCTGCGGGSLSGGTAGMIASWVNATTLTATGTPTFASFFATSSTATSSILGSLRISTTSPTAFVVQDGYGTGLFNVNTSSTSGPLLEVEQATNTISLFTVLQNGFVGISTSSPFAKLSITGDTSIPLFAISTSTDMFGQMMIVTATTSTMIGSVVGGDIGVRFAIGTTTIRGFSPLDQMTINGRINSSWRYTDCDVFNSQIAQIAADTASVCGEYVFIEDTAAVADIGVSQTGSGDIYARIRTGTAGTASAASDGGGISWLTAFLGTATNTPVMEVTARKAVLNNATSSLTVIGFANYTGVSADYATMPTNGCYFEASSTSAQSNWWLVSAKGSTRTYTNTNVASSTSVTGTGQFQKFRIELSTNSCVGYIATGGGEYTKITNTTNVPTIVPLNPVASIADVGVAGLAKELHIRTFRVWFRGVDDMIANGL